MHPDMNPLILEDIPFNPDSTALVGQGGVNHPDSASIVEELILEARTIARPRGGYIVAMVEERGPDHVIIDGLRINSRVLGVNFAHTKRVFPYIGTGGREIDDWAKSQDDSVRRFWAQRICELALGSALDALTEHIEIHLQTGPTSKVNPGSTIDWPLEGQRELFCMLGDIANRIGVHLAENLWMHPTSSSSGIRYPSEETFENCSLCPREECRLRNAPYQDGLYKSRYLS